MKKLLALLFAAIFAASVLTACGDKPKRDTDKKTATEKVTEAVTEAQTEEVTDAPTEAETDAPTIADTAFTYTDPAGKYQLTVPVIWNDTGLIMSETDVDGNECVRFYYQAAYEQGAGHVFSIVLVEDASKMMDVTQLPHAEDIYNDGSKQVYVIYPTDVQFAPYGQPGSAEFNKQQEEYSALSETKEEIIGSFTFI